MPRTFRLFRIKKKRKKKAKIVSPPLHPLQTIFPPSAGICALPRILDGPYTVHIYATQPLVCASYPFTCTFYNAHVFLTNKRTTQYAQAEVSKPLAKYRVSVLFFNFSLSLYRRPWFYALRFVQMHAICSFSVKVYISLLSFVAAVKMACVF